jgi:hypothetical protein
MMPCRAGRFGLTLVLAAVAVTCGACSSPNRGHWQGTFDGNVAGTVEFDINARGTSLDGKMEGQTRDGQPFKAELEGRIEDPFFYAKFVGRVQTGVYPLKFEGLMRGELASGTAKGDWSCTLVPTETKLEGTWETSQQK